MDVKQITIPNVLRSKLEAWSGKYTEPKTVYQLIWVDSDVLGVFGDGENGMYEWFILHAGRLITSDKGYGDDFPALRDGIEEYLASVEAEFLSRANEPREERQQQ